MAVYWDETSASEDGEAIIWNLQSGGWNKTQTQLPESHGSFDSFQISPSGRFTAVKNPADTAWDRPCLGVYRLDNDQLVWLCDDLNGYVGLLAFSPDETILAVEIDPGVVLWDAETGEILKRLQGFEGDILQLSFSPDGNILAAATTEEVTLWDLSALYRE
jgi:WD40 repeat protein